MIPAVEPTRDVGLECDLEKVGVHDAEVYWTRAGDEVVLVVRRHELVDLLELHDDQIQALDKIQQAVEKVRAHP